LRGLLLPIIPLRTIILQALRHIGKSSSGTDMGIINQLQLSSMKRAGMFKELKPRLLELFMAFIPFINY
jgi:hypothetical protein